MTTVNADKLREEFVRLLTEDSETSDRRRKEYNLAIFHSETDKMFPGVAIWTNTDLGMVLEKFDKAVKNLRRGK